MAIYNTDEWLRRALARNLSDYHELIAKSRGVLPDDVVDSYLRQPQHATAPADMGQMMADVDLVLEHVREEVRQSMIKHRPYASAHEAWAVIKEELDELWEEVRADNGYAPEAMAEAKQVACTAVRYILHLHDRGQS